MKGLKVTGKGPIVTPLVVCSDYCGKNLPKASIPVGSVP